MAALSQVTAVGETAHRRHAIEAPEDVGALRRTIAQLAAAVPGVRAGDVALVVTELASNLLHHAVGGYVLYRTIHRGIEVLAVDRGPGMSDGSPGAASTFSDVTAGPTAARPAGLGVGLAGVEHLAQTFEVYSVRPGGTVVLARLLAAPPTVRWCRWGAVNVAVDGSAESGDGWAVTGAEEGGALDAMVVDGLGHGTGAAEAARAATSAFFRRPRTPPADLIRTAHETMRATRGGVMAACSIDPAGSQVRYAGVGNISGRILRGGHSLGLVSRDGTLGTHVAVPRADVSQYPWGPGATLILWSDGLRSGWDPLDYPGLFTRDPAIVAATLHRDHGRPNDDVTVLVIEDLRRADGDPG